MYILNRVPSKSVPKTPFELWTGRKPSLNHLHVWGYLAEVRIYNPFESKINHRITCYFFIGYLDHSKGYRFYCPTPGVRLVESQTEKFLELDIADLGTSQHLNVDGQSEVVPISLPNVQTFCFAYTCG